MVHVVFDTASIGYDDFIQSGGGLPGMENNSPLYFQGMPPYQRGYGMRMQGGAGIGDVFRGLWRFFLPLIRRMGTAASSEAISTGQRVLERMSQGEPIKATLIGEAKKGADNLLEKGGLGRQFGSGRRKRIKANQSIIPTSSLSKPIVQVKKRLRSDAFGLY
jgi:hypothetical protein